MSHLDHILIYKFRTKEEFKHILYHEIGHHVFRHKLNSVQRKKWVTQVYPKSAHVSEYATTNANEDFAETYAFYVQNSIRVSAIPTKLEFMQKVFSPSN